MATAFSQALPLPVEKNKPGLAVARFDAVRPYRGSLISANIRSLSGENGIAEEAQGRPWAQQTNGDPNRADQSEA
jgi:hypothetical protein